VRLPLRRLHGLQAAPESRPVLNMLSPPKTLLPAHAPSPLQGKTGPSDALPCGSEFRVPTCTFVLLCAVALDRGSWEGRVRASPVSAGHIWGHILATSGGLRHPDLAVSEI